MHLRPFLSLRRALASLGWLPPPQVAGSVAHSLETAVRSVQSSPGEAFDAIRWLLQLRAVGVPAAQGMDPVG